MNYLTYSLVFVLCISFVYSGSPIVPGYPCPADDVAGGCLGDKECHYPNPKDCISFIQCTAGTIAYRMPCPAGLQWNDNEKICDWPYLSTCPDNNPGPVPDSTTTENPCTSTTPRTTTAGGPPLCPGVSEQTTTTTSAPTQPSTPTPTQPSTPTPTQPSTPTPTQPSTPTPTQPSTPTPTQPSTAAPTQPSTAAPTQPTTTSRPWFVCPPEDILNTACKGPKDCLYPHPDPTKCNLFIHCEVNADNRTGRPTVKECPAGLEWSDIEKRCEWPYLSTCGGKVPTTVPTQPPTTVPTQPPTTARTQPPTTARTQPPTTARTQPPTTARTQPPTTARTQPPTTARTQPPTTAPTQPPTTVPTQPSTTSKPWFVCPPEDILSTSCKGPKDCLYPYTPDCSKFIHCEVNTDNRTGRPTIKDCPEGLEWSDVEKRCEWPYLSTCGGKTPPPPSTTPPTTPTLPKTTATTPQTTTERTTTPAWFVCPPEDIINTACMGPKDCLYPYTPDCSQFIHCEVNADNRTGRPTLKDCPEGLEWSDVEKRCEWPYLSTCNGKVQSLKFVCPKENCAKSLCLYPNPTACNSFYQCTPDGRAIVQPCSGGLEWNDKSKVCDWPVNSTCRR